MSITGQTCLPHAIITGASRGLGLALAREFWSRGYSLTITASSSKSIEAAKALFQNKTGQKLLAIGADLKHSDSPEHIISAAQSNFESLDVLINNAAIHGPIADVEETEALEWDEALRVNLLAPVSLCRLAVPWMKHNGRGKIINISGGGASGPRPKFSAYAASKAGLVRFSETLAAELAGTALAVNCIAPGPMATNLLNEIVSAGPLQVGLKEFSDAEKIFELGAGTISDALALCLFLASSDSDGITGKLISAIWDDYQDWPNYLRELKSSDLYTMRRITGRDRNTGWGDK